MGGFFLSAGYLISLAIDVAVIFFVMGAMKIRGNSLQKAVILTLVSAILGVVLSPLLVLLFFLSHKRLYYGVYCNPFHQAFPD